jgi:Fe-S-cluster containining protein
MGFNLPDVCKQCGSCCKAIHIHTTKKEIKEFIDYYYPDGLTDEERFDSDITFIYSFFEEITPKEAIENNPEHDLDFVRDRVWYKCKFLTEDNKCGCHGNRPRICRLHPWYLEPKTSDYGFFRSDCGFREYIESKEHNRIMRGELNTHFNSDKIKLKALGITN